MRAAAADNTAPAVSCGANAAWVDGNVLVDRDRAGADRRFGVSIAGGVVVFGVSGEGTGDLTICSARGVLDDRWHHVAVERRRSDGWMWIFVDGVLEAQADGPDGDVSYPDDATAADPNDPFLVLGAEKYDAGAAYDGFLEEVRISSALRYTSVFTRPKGPFTTDADTAALYHLDEGAGLVVGDSSGASGGPSDGTLFTGGSPSGPEWTGTAAPLGGAPSIVLTALPGSVSGPMQIANAHDGSSRLFVVEQAGTIRIYKNGALLATPFLDIHTIVQCCGEQGLLSVAFHPDYASNGYFYVYYIDKIASSRRHHDRAVQRVGKCRRRRSGFGADPAGRAAPDQREPQRRAALLRPGRLPLCRHRRRGRRRRCAEQRAEPERPARKDAPHRRQRLRRNPLRAGGPGPYAIPPSNPFAGDPNDCHEVWAYGMRNPWRYSFDRLTGDLLIGDVGQELYEEIDFQAAASAGGENYGWHKMEGFHCYNPGSNCNDGTLTLPILEQPHTTGWCAIIGGMRYRGTVIPALDGTYLYSDNCLGDIYSGTQAGNGSWTTALLKANAFNVSGFGEDEAGEVYFADLGGDKVYRIDPSPSPSPVAGNLVPSSVIAGDPGFNLFVNGSGYVYGSVVRWNGADRPTTLLSASQLRATISAGDIAAAGTASVTVFTPAPGGGTSSPLTVDINPTFLDVPVTNFAHQYIQAVFDAGVTAGCGPRLYCPDASTTRAQMAVFLLKAGQGSAYVPPACTGTVFNDVPCTGGAFDPWIEDLATRGITGGCGGGNYCPAATVTRAQMAVFLLKESQASGYAPPACTGTVFNDVPCTGGPFDPWIEDLAARAITGGCGGGNYCPGSSVTRAQMAVFLTKTFNLTLP